MQSKKADKLARFYYICGCGDTVAPAVPMELVPPTQLEQDDDDEFLPLPAPDLEINNEAADNIDLTAVILTTPSLDLANT